MTSNADRMVLTRDYKLILLVIPTTQQIPSLAEEVLSRKISKFDKFITIIYSGV